MSNSRLRSSPVSTFSLFPSASSGVGIAPPPHRPFLARLILQTEERCSGRPAVQVAFRLVMNYRPWRSDSLHVVAYLRQHRQHRLRNLKRSSQGGGWLGPPIVTEAADDADDVMGSVLTHGRDPDCPRSLPPLAAEDNFNPECAEEALRPAQPPSECPGGSWLARTVDAKRSDARP